MTVPFAFIFTQNMNHEDQLKEMHSKVRQCTLPEKKTMLVMICLTMTYKSICSTARAAAAVLGVVYIPHTTAQYLLFIDRLPHQTYIAAVAAAVLAGVTPPADPDPYSEPLADAHSELQSAFDEHISRNHWHIVHAGAGAVALNAAQAVKIADSLATLMKDCNSYLSNALFRV